MNWYLVIWSRTRTPGPFEVSESSLCAVYSTFFDKNKKFAHFHFIHRLECDIVNHLLQAQLQTSHWQFLPSLLHLNDARTKLTSLSTVAPVKEVSMSWDFSSWTIEILFLLLSVSLKSRFPLWMKSICQSLIKKLFTWFYLAEQEVNIWLQAATIACATSVVEQI